jgi:hypothetical protein
MRSEDTFRHLCKIEVALRERAQFAPALLDRHPAVVQDRYRVVDCARHRARCACPSKRGAAAERERQKWAGPPELGDRG